MIRRERTEGGCTAERQVREDQHDAKLTKSERLAAELGQVADQKAIHHALLPRPPRR